MRLLFIILFFIVSLAISAQVTIGSEIEPIEGAILDLKENQPDNENVTAKKGFVLPRVALTAKDNLSPLVDNASEVDKKQHTGVTVYNVKEVPATATKEALKPGLNVWNGTEWETIGRQSHKFFYMPTFNLPLNQTSFNLYEEYVRQFSPQPTNTKFHSSAGDNIALPVVYSQDELIYAALDYDSDLITVTGITSGGIMNYTVIGNDAPLHSYITVVCIVKE